MGEDGPLPFVHNSEVSHKLWLLTYHTGKHSGQTRQGLVRCHHPLTVTIVVVMVVAVFRRISTDVCSPKNIILKFEHIGFHCFCLCRCLIRALFQALLTPGPHSPHPSFRSKKCHSLWSCLHQDVTAAIPSAARTSWPRESELDAWLAWLQSSGAGGKLLRTNMAIRHDLRTTVRHCKHPTNGKTAICPKSRSHVWTTAMQGWQARLVSPLEFKTCRSRFSRIQSHWMAKVWSNASGAGSTKCDECGPTATLGKFAKPCHIHRGDPL